MNEIDANILTAAQHLRSALALLRAAEHLADNAHSDAYYALAEKAYSLLNDTQEQLK